MPSRDSVILAVLFISALSRPADALPSPSGYILPALSSSRRLDLPAPKAKTNRQKIETRNSPASDSQMKSPGELELSLSLKEAEAALLAREPERALRIFNHVAYEFGDALPAEIGVARVYFILGRTEQCCAKLQELSKKYPQSSEPYARLGDLYLSCGNLGLAEKQLKIAVQLNQTDSQSYYQLAQIAVLNKAPAQALIYLNRALQSSPQNTGARVLRARLLFDDGALAPALSDYNQALRRDPANAQLLSETASLLSWQGKSKEALEKLWQAYKLSPDSAEIQKLFITVYGGRHDWSNAQDAANSLNQLSPHDAKARLVLGWCRLMNHEFDEAIATLKEAVELAPAQAELHNFYGISLLERRKYEEALEQFKSALTINPDFLPARLNLAAAESFQEHHDRALAQMSALQIKYPGTLPVMSLHAYLLLRAGRSAEAEQLNRQCLSLNGQDVLSCISAGMLFRQRREFVESEAALQKACRLDADSPLALCELSSTYLAASKGNQALDAAQSALQIAPANLDAKAAMAMAFIQEKNLEGAIFLLKECVVRNPKNLFLRMTLANSQLARGEPEFAELTLEKAHTLFPDSAEPLSGLAGICLAGHNYHQAENLLEEALRCTPQNPEILMMLARTYFAMGKPEACLQRLSTLADSSLTREAVLLKARCNYSLQDYTAACADYDGAVRLQAQMEAADILHLAQSALAIGQAQRAQEWLNRLQADTSLLKQCKQSQIEKLETEIRHALVKVAH